MLEFENTRLMLLYKELSYGHKKEVCKVIANECKRQPESVRNWFISHKRVPIEFEQIVFKYLQLETIKMNIQFCNDPVMIFEMNRKCRELDNVNNIDQEEQMAKALINELETLFSLNGVVGRSEQCAHNKEPILDKNGHYECPDCGKYGEDC